MPQSGRPSQRASSRTPVRSTHCPIGSIKPVSSASGMNSAGEIMPRVGWFQRISASAPTTGRHCRPAAGSEAGIRPSAGLPQVRLERGARRPAALHLGSKKRTLARPAAFASYIARSARLSSSSSVAFVGLEQRHADAGRGLARVAVELERSVDGRAKRSQTHWRARPRGRVAAQVLEEDHEFVAAERATTIVFAHAGADARRDLAEQLVAAWWPFVSLIALKWSRSMNSSAPWRPWRSAGEGS